MNSAPDVVVVGGGPCGSTVASSLAKHRASTTVFEEHAQVGIPCHCAGHVSINGLKRLNLYPLPNGIIEHSFCGATFHSPKGNAFSIRFSSPVTCVVNRILFDKYIAEMAKASGATYELESRVESLLVRHGLVEGVIVNKNGQVEEVSARIVIDAEGVASRLVRQLGLRTRGQSRLVHAVQAEVDGAEYAEPNMVEVFLGKKFAPGFYSWLIPKGEGKAKIGLAAETGNPRDLLEKFMLKHPVASVWLRKAKVLQASFHPISLGGPIPKAYSDGFLALGDAASQVKPTTGGGLVLGSTCAEIAARVVLESLQTRDYSAQFLSTYQEQCNRILRFDMSVMLRIRRMLDGMSDRRIDELIRLCATLRLDRALLSVKDMDFQGKSLLRALRSPRVLALLGYLLFFYLAANP
jgi:digeranylgeranylglycerophospholipid reductase